jgi:ABC-2 type transport system ATP-binding protein
MIKINNLSKKYGNQTVFSNINLTFNTGDIVALAGANGSGKSTLINAIADLIQIDSGSISIDEVKIGKKEFKYRSKVGYVLERPTYIKNLTLKEYFEFLTSFYPEQTIDKAHIDRVMSILGLGFEKKIIQEYSKGQKKRISIAAALLHKPNILILDEPFDGLDINVLKVLFEFIKEMANNGAIVVLVAHDPNHIYELCNRIVVLKNTNIVLDTEVNKNLELFKQQIAAI